MASAVSRIMGQYLYKCEEHFVSQQNQQDCGVLFLLVSVSLIFSDTIRDFLLLKINFKIYLLVWMFYLLDVCEPSAAHRGQMRASDSQTGITDGCESSCSCRESNLGPLQ